MKRCWRSIICPVSLLPPVLGSADMAGALGAEAAAELGLAPGTPVACGGGDAACAVVGSGVDDADTLMINAGTAVQVIELQDEPSPFDRETANRYLFELGVAGQTFAIGALNSAGHSLGWWRGLMNPSLTHDEFEALAADEPSAEDGPLFLPWLQGTGTPYLLDGPYGSFVQLSSTADRRTLTRAVMDGVALGIRLCAEALVERGKLADKQVLITGGVPKSPLMRRILSNVFAGQRHVPQFQRYVGAGRGGSCGGGGGHQRERGRLPGGIRLWGNRARAGADAASAIRAAVCSIQALGGSGSGGVAGGSGRVCREIDLPPSYTEEKQRAQRKACVEVFRSSVDQYTARESQVSHAKKDCKPFGKHVRASQGSPLHALDDYGDSI